MHRSKYSSASLVARLALVALGIASATGSCLAAETLGSSQSVASLWQHHQVNFTYYGITALYTCDSLETNIRGLLLYLGARNDAKVSALACPRGSSVPSRTAIVQTDFYTLAPSADASAPDAVQARWTSFEVNPWRPHFMGDGDCELIEEMQDLITKSFSLRDLKYRTDCVPRTINIHGFSIKAQALKAVTPPITGATSN
jgi:hypothetical protein